VYVAFLRGINVGGKNIVSMASLKANFEQIGLQDVTTGRSGASGGSGGSERDGARRL
jgi:uncharacterized protein (DUF1697 family)